MTKQELVAALAAKTGLTKTQAGEAVDTLGEIIRDEMRVGGDVSLPGVCKLSIKTRAARIGRNPKTGAELKIAAKAVPHFSAAQALKDAVTG